MARRRELWISIRRWRGKSMYFETAVATLNLTLRYVGSCLCWCFSVSCWSHYLHVFAQLSIPADGHGPEDGSCLAGDRDSGVDKTRQGLQIKTKLCSSNQNSWGSPWYQPGSGPGHVFCCQLQQEHPATNRYKLPAWVVEILSPWWSFWFWWWRWNKVQLSVVSWCDTVKLNISLFVLSTGSKWGEHIKYFVRLSVQVMTNFTVSTSCH